MVTTIRQELIKLALAEKENKSIAKILAYYYPSIDLSDRKKLFESLMYYYRIPVDFDFKEFQEKIDEENNTEDYRNKDFRIKSVEIANLRGIPEQGEYPFGINFIKNETVNNAIILANNGTGKSSIFAGLEMIFAQEISEKNLRVFNPQRLKSSEYNAYITRLQSNKKPVCEIKTNAGDFNLNNVIFNENELKLFNPSTHFISDYDIYHFGQLDFSGNADDDKSFHYLLASTLGLGDFIQFESSLNELVNYGRTTESRQLSKQQAELYGTINNIELWSNQIIEKKETLVKLKEEKQNAIAENINISKLSLVKELTNKSISFEIDENLYNNGIDDFLTQFHKFQSQETKDDLSLEKDFLEIGMSLLHNSDNCPFCRDSNKTIAEIQSDTRKRFEKLKELLTDKDELIQSYKSAIEQINNFFQQTNYLYNLISTERSQLRSYQELDELSILEDNMYVRYSPLLADEELIGYISNLNTLFPKNKNLNSLFKLIIDNNELIIKFALKSIQDNTQFIAQRKVILDNILKDLSSSENENTVEKQVGVIEDELVRLEIQLQEAQKRKENLEKDVEQAKASSDLVMEIKDEIKEFLPKYKLIANNLVQEAFDPVKDMISNIMSDFLKDDKDITLSIETKETKRLIDGEEKIESLIIANIQYVDTNTGEIKIVSPSHYFNNFRYKLFCLMISLSLALSTRKKYGINLPLVMDDLFYASDFVSKHRFSKFISKVIELFYKYTPRLPLQFILFTHDDLIFRNAIDALNSNTIALEIDPLLKRTIIGRIFSVTDNQNLQKVSIENNQLIYNLLYEFPQEIINN